jgi:hypothetical protein
MKYAGIDYSMTSPAIATFDTKTQEFHYHFYTGNKKLFSKDNFHMTLHSPWNCNEERFDQISNWALTITKDCEKVFVEEYAFAAKGRVFGIGENTGLLKHKLWANRIPFDTVNPKALKKWVAGNGNAGKEMMETAFVIDTGIQVREIIGQAEKDENPSSDIIDSHYILSWGLQTL